MLSRGAMVQPLTFVRNNLPSSKPELWRNAPLVLRRRLLAWLSNKVDPGWAFRPCLVTIEPEGLLLEVLPHETVSRSIVYYGVYEYAPSALVRAYLAPGDTFVDVGANMGYYSILAAGCVGATGRVVAFEPSQRVRQRLERSVSLNGFVHVEVRHEAVSDVNGHVTLVEPGSDNHGLAFVQKNGDVDSGARVPSITLDDALGTSRTPALIKIDVEGGEAEVFRGASRSLAAADGPAILFESFRLESDRVLLESHGYQLFCPGLHQGRFCLRALLPGAPSSYRQWEAPNYFAAKGERGRAFVAKYLLTDR